MSNRLPTCTLNTLLPRLFVLLDLVQRQDRFYIKKYKIITCETSLTNLLKLVHVRRCVIFFVHDSLQLTSVIIGK